MTTPLSFISPAQSDPSVRAASSSKAIHVACVGDSITFGATIDDRDTDSYPAQLQSLLGNEWRVSNFGISGCTMLKAPTHHTTRSYWQTEAFEAATRSEPDVVVIKLGTNDLWHDENWRHKDQYVSDFHDMLHVVQNLPTRPRIWICLPTAAFEDRAELHRNLTECHQLLRRLAADASVGLIDTFTPLADHPEFFPDKCHPNRDGAAALAATVHRALTDSDPSP